MLEGMVPLNELLCNDRYVNEIISLRLEGSDPTSRLMFKFKNFSFVS